MQKEINLTAYMKPYSELMRYSFYVNQGMMLSRFEGNTYLLVYVIEQNDVGFYNPAVIEGLEHVTDRIMGIGQETHVFRIADEDRASLYLWTSKDERTPTSITHVTVNAMNNMATLYDISPSDGDVWTSAVECIKEEEGVTE